MHLYGHAVTLPVEIRLFQTIALTVFAWRYHQPFFHSASFFKGLMLSNSAKGSEPIHNDILLTKKVQDRRNSSLPNESLVVMIASRVKGASIYLIYGISIQIFIFDMYICIIKSLTWTKFRRILGSLPLHFFWFFGQVLEVDSLREKKMLGAGKCVWWESLDQLDHPEIWRKHTAFPETSGPCRET